MKGVKTLSCPRWSWSIVTMKNRSCNDMSGDKTCQCWTIDSKCANTHIEWPSTQRKMSSIMIETKNSTFPVISNQMGNCMDTMSDWPTWPSNMHKIFSINKKKIHHPEWKRMRTMVSFGSALNIPLLQPLVSYQDVLIIITGERPGRPEKSALTGQLWITMMGNWIKCPRQRVKTCSQASELTDHAFVRCGLIRIRKILFACM